MNNVLDFFKRKSFLLFLFFAVLVFVVYSNSLNNGFVSDDIGIVINTPRVEFLASNPIQFFRGLLYYGTYRVAGFSPIAFRLSNIAFHIGTVWLLYVLVSMTVHPTVAILAASLFAVHPILVESVAWISGGVYPQYSFFVLLALLSYIRLKKDRRWLWIFLLSVFFAFTTSEKAIVLPFILILYEFAFGSIKKYWKHILIVTLVACTFAFTYIFRLNGRYEYVQAFYSQIAAVQNPFIQIPIAITTYLRIIFWPDTLSIFRPGTVITSFEYWIRVGIFLLFLCTIAINFAKNRPVFFWLSLFLISLAPTLTPLGINAPVAERYAYLGTAGIVTVFAMWLYQLLKIKKAQPFVYILFIGILVALGARTMIRNQDWKDDFTFTASLLKAYPTSPHIHIYLGTLYARRGEYQKAIDEFKVALTYKSDYAVAYYNIGRAQDLLGYQAEAIDYYRKALVYNPKIKECYLRLANFAVKNNNYTEAEVILQKGILELPKDSDLYAQLGYIYLTLGDKDKARKSFQSALLLKPTNLQAREGLNRTTQ